MRWLYHLIDADAELGDPYAPPSLATEGFVHCSYLPAVAESARRYFAGRDVRALQLDPRLLTCAIDVADTPRGPMPHVLGPIPRRAIVAIRSLAELDDPATALADEARLLLEAGELDAAHAQAVTAACLAPFEPVHDELVGDCFAALGRLEEAADAYGCAVARAPDRAGAWSRLGVVAERLGDLEAAATAFERALAVEPATLEALRELASVRVRQRRLDEAAALYRRLRDAAPADPTAAHMLAALAGESPPAPPPGHVRALFDGYAPDFDDSLIGDLGYEVPGALRAALGDRRFARALDLGCGTGLGGAAIRDRVAWLEGVDASPNMVALAGKRGGYDALAVGDLVDHLRAPGEPYDLILAADVLLYLGDLAPVHAAARARLAEGGWFVYSVEAGDAAYRLAPTGRYTHGRAYLEALAGAHGFDVVRLDPGTLRREAGAPVAGWIAVLARTAVR